MFRAWYCCRVSRWLHVSRACERLL